MVRRTQPASQPGRFIGVVSLRTALQGGQFAPGTALQGGQFAPGTWPLQGALGSPAGLPVRRQHRQAGATEQLAKTLGACCAVPRGSTTWYVKTKAVCQPDLLTEARPFFGGAGVALLLRVPPSPRSCACHGCFAALRLCTSCATCRPTRCCCRCASATGQAL